MHHILGVLSILMLSINISYAASTEPQKKGEEISSNEETGIELSRKQLQSVVNENSFFSDKPAVFHPSCDNPRLLEKVLARIEQYYKETPSPSIVDKRRQALMLRQLETFVPVDVNSFPPKENYAVADRLIDIKINDGIKSQDLSLCKSKGEREIYLLIYPQDSFYTVEIINFPGQPISKDFTTVYD